MRRFMIFNDEDKQETKFEYEVGEIITFNSTMKAKCIKKEESDNELLQYFKIGKVVYDFS